MRHLLWILLPGLLLHASGCKRGQDEEGTVQPARAPVTVEVTNYFALPVDVDAVGSGSRFRLGTVYPGLASSFVIPQTILATTTVELEARASSTRHVGRSGPLLMAPGSVIDFTITAQLFNSTATIRP